ncbi:MAG: glutathione S-transferase [Hyphomicrobium sp.]|nr:glutathione S-transferase [Hyphomicrobium sp.]
MKVYEFKGFPNPQRVRIALAEKGLMGRVDFIHVDVPKGEQRKPEFLKKNPAGAVPVLELDDGTTIAECTAITEYVDGLVGPRTLTGETPVERATIHMMQRRAEAWVLDAVGAYFHNATAGLGPQLEKDQNPQWGEKQRERALEGMRYFDEVLSTKPFVAGQTFTMADITLLAGLGFARFAGIEVSPNYQNLLTWEARVAARPSVAA